LAQPEGLTPKAGQISAQINNLNEIRSEVGIKFTEVKGQLELLQWRLGFMLAGTVAILFKIFY